MPKATPPPLYRDCVCARIGYALVLCQDHAPIPFELTDKGKKGIRHMKQWDAIIDSLEQRRAEEQAEVKVRTARTVRTTRRKPATRQRSLLISG